MELHGFTRIRLPGFVLIHENRPSGLAPDAGGLGLNVTGLN